MGIGNIGGVAVAISIGGPGAAFWLFLAGFLGMSTKFVECTLGVKYRKSNSDGSVSGGPMYYLESFLSSRGYPGCGKMLGSFYAISLGYRVFWYRQHVSVESSIRSIFIHHGRR